MIWVGDIKQSIYGFRGSDPTLMAAVVQRVTEDGNAPEILEKSWRSTPELVAYTNNLFVPAFADTLKPEQVALQPARDPFTDEPAVELWRLAGRQKIRARPGPGQRHRQHDGKRQNRRRQGQQTAAPGHATAISPYCAAPTTTSMKSPMP